MAVVGCSPDFDREPIGEPCSVEDDTLCDSLCLLDLPEGMCSHDCSDDDDVCPDGFVCGDISGGRYCLMECNADGDCRDGMICVVEECRVPVGYGAPCEENDDCASGICYEEECNVECHAASDCPEDLSCVDVGEGVPLCAERRSLPDGPGTSGDNCSFSDCDDDYDCVSRTEDPENDPNAFCARSCLNELDCPEDMTCRRTQLIDERRSTLRCVPREFCERCAYDAQCAFGGDLCVSQDPLRGRGRYCSQSCDPEREGTCPTDTSCHEAFWCEADRSWVADCDWCSDEDTCDEAEDGSVYQCFHDFGACAGDGSEYCAPCYVDDDCPDGGICYFAQYMANNFCTMPCPEDDGAYECPAEHGCFELEGADEPQCMPRQGSCSEPSGGVTTCYSCDGWGDCVTGQCMSAYAHQGRNGPMVCWEDCPRGDRDCPDFSICYTFTDRDGNDINLCGPPDDWSCTRVQLCQEDCPDGEGECPRDARDECRDY